MALQEILEALAAEIQGKLTADREGYRLEAVLAERKAFLSRRKLVYQARFRIDETARRVTLSERLQETGLGMGSAGDLEMSAGIGFKKESYRVGRNGERSGTIEEQSRLFGKKYDYRFSFGPWREKIKQAIAAAGFAVAP
ncbi:MAG: hypothetical protein MUF69_09735 [Desulfobacterota bacterium]|jgi:hypothetical protein|nr:hypothetical protein [Thermodesulfobacteriota bacterium]